MANITYPSLRREEALRRECEKNLKSPGLPIYEDIINLPSIRLKSRNPSWKIMDDPSCGIVDCWKEALVNLGFHLPRKEWSTLNRYRSGDERCAVTSCRNGIWLRMLGVNVDTRTKQ